MHFHPFVCLGYSFILDLAGTLAFGALTAYTEYSFILGFGNPLV